MFFHVFTGCEARKMEIPVFANESMFLQNEYRNTL